ncbi:sulfite exporter TauE/SafE family protein [Chondromyces crocatus]|uniref:Probable membrane transporter protein n=1 Tax=Chondromyces crocatus TaxID=52 RepID=A0A0K1EDG1_CHOCO|nr:sulfite exporter TauE/SafE family protein [Chondromyces crocatus]AKT38915.1 membrane protein [Chondromyces crocatus]
MAVEPVLPLVIGTLLSLAAGLSLGLLGGGGSLLTMPILVYVVGLPPRDAIVTSLVVVGATSATALLAHARAGRVVWRVGAVFGAAGMVGAVVGARVGAFVPETLLLLSFAALMLVVAWAMLRERGASTAQEGLRDAAASVGASPGDAAPPCAASGVAAAAGAASPRVVGVLRHGFGVGVLTGLVGAGGGFLVVPALVLFSGLAIPDAVGTSLLVITLNATAGLAGAALRDVTVPWSLAGGMAGASMLGSLLGARLGREISPGPLRQGFGVFVIAIATFMVAREIGAQLQVPPAHAATLGGVVSTGIAGLCVWRLRKQRWSAAPPPLASRG